MSNRDFKKIVVAIDGPAGAGKSSVARILAQRLGFVLLDTGALYRALAVYLLGKGVDPDSGLLPERIFAALDLRIDPAEDLTRVYLQSKEISAVLRAEAVGVAASKFARQAAVRRELLDHQRNCAAIWDVVAEGRDMGTAVFPDAFIKFYVTADPAVRSLRRLRQLSEKGIKAQLDQVFADMRERDERDTKRPVAPLVRAVDAIEIETTHLDVEGVVSRLLHEIKQRTAHTDVQLTVFSK